MKVTSRPFDPAVALREAVALHQQGQLREAERIYTRLLKAAPDVFDALNLLGGIKMQQGQLGEAQRLFAAAVKANPRIAAAWSNLGQAQHALKRPAKAWTRLARLRRTISTFSISMPTCS
jgi:predicted Zn-dependent protease